MVAHFAASAPLHESTNHVLKIHTVGMTQWDVEIRDDTLRRYRERDFITEIHSTFESLTRDRELKIITLKGEHFDLGVPRHWLTAMNEARTPNRRR